jgi:hypothetical protein
MSRIGLIFSFALLLLTMGLHQVRAADMFTVEGVKVEATAASATAARENALAQGRPEAWQRLYRRLTPPSEWDYQPQLGDDVLERIIYSFEVNNERRSTTRYLAEVTYHFNADAVRRLLKQSSVTFTETQTKPILVVPLMAGANGYNPSSAWAQAWMDPLVAQGLVPVVVPTGDGADLGVLSNANETTLTWSTLSSMMRRYNASGVVLAVATPSGASVTLVQLSATGRQTQSLSISPASLSAAAEQAAEKLSEDWKEKSAVDYSKPATLTADVTLKSLADWSKIRSQIARVKSVTDFDVIGLSLSEAQIRITYYGQLPQLKDAMGSQNLALDGANAPYRLRNAPANTELP